MNPIRILFLTVTLLMCNTGLFAQSEYDNYLQNAEQRLREGDCTSAQKHYNIYKELTGKTNAGIEDKIKKCKGEVTAEITAKIDSVWVECDVYESRTSNVKGLKIHIKFSTYNMLDIDGRISAYFHLKDGTALNDTNGKYKTANGKVSVGKNFKPTYERATYKDFTLFMPYDELHLPSGKYDIKFNVNIWEFNTEEARCIASSEYTNLTYTKP